MTSRPLNPRHGRDRSYGRADEDGEEGPGWLWGLHAAQAALANPARRIERIVATRNAAHRLGRDIPGLQILDPDAIDGMLPPGAVHQGLAVRALPLPPLELHEACAAPDGRPVLMLDGVTDPQNVGAAFRAAAAFGARAVVLQDRKSPPFTGALAKAAAGAVDIVPHVRVTNLARALEELAALGYQTIGLEGESEAALGEAIGSRACVFVAGAEGKGLRPSVAAACERLAHIPIAPAMESLNVAVAAAIALYEARRRL
ncbi:MAG: TrmH family RNA methyltransferase [Hyphomonadaceae bacterium]